MSWIIAIIGIIVAVYIGTVIGVYSLCMEISELYKVRKYAVYVPGFMVLCIIYGFLSGNRESREIIIKFLRTPQKCMIMLAVLAEIVAKEKVKQPKKVLKKKVVFGDVVNQFQNGFRDVKPFYY